MNLWGREYTKREIQKFSGDTTQFFGLRKTVIDDGPGRGMRCWEVTTGAGLSFSVLPDRGMDLGWCNYKSIPIGFISKTGLVAPSLCEYGGNLFLRAFMGGLLTTCGFTHMGAACIDDGQALGLHGRAGMLVADNTKAEGYWQEDEYTIILSGSMREASVLGENLQMNRTIRVNCGANIISIVDMVENCGFTRQPLMLLYHFNFGHPLVGPNTKLITSETTHVRARDWNAESGLSHYDSFEVPTPDYKEQVFYHTYSGLSGPIAFAGLTNNDVGLSVKISFNLDELPYLIQWKQMGEGDYVCGIEPATWYPEGRAAARERNELIYLEPGQTRKFQLDICLDDM